MFHGQTQADGGAIIKDIDSVAGDLESREPGFNGGSVIVKRERHIRGARRQTKTREVGGEDVILVGQKRNQVTKLRGIARKTMKEQNVGCLGGTVFDVIGSEGTQTVDIHIEVLVKRSTVGGFRHSCCLLGLLSWILCLVFDFMSTR